jgi:hypothetical protein
MLYAVMLGGKHPKAHIEVHDVVFAVGDSLQALYPQLKQQWFGLAKGLHVDAWIAIDGIEQYQVQLSPVAPQPDALRLYFINLGGYLPDEFGEAHRYVLIVAHSKMQARGRARKYTLKQWQQPHVDAVLDVDDCVLIDQVGGHFVHLVEGSHQGVKFENCYLLIG